MPTSAAAAARTTERLKTDSFLSRKRDSILSLISTATTPKPTKRDKDQPIAECFGTSARCERGTTVVEEEAEWDFQPRQALKYAALGVTVVALPVLITPLVGIMRENGDGGIMTQFFGALIALTLALLAFCSLQIWTFEGIPTVMLLSFGLVLSLSTFGTVAASLHFIPSGEMYQRIIRCADPSRVSTIRNCGVMLQYLDVMTAAQSFTLLSSFSVFMDCCFSLSQSKEDKGKGIENG